MYKIIKSICHVFRKIDFICDKMWEELEILFKDKKTINALKLESPIKLIKITDDNVVIKTANNKFRIISRKEIEDPYIYLMQKGKISRVEIQRFFSPRNPAYVASIPANLEGINHYSKPKIVLYISHEKRKIADKILNFGEINSDAFSSNRIKYKTLKHQYLNSFNKCSSNIPKEDESRSEEYDSRGFDKEGIHKITKTKYDIFGKTKQL